MSLKVDESFELWCGEFKATVIVTHIGKSVVELVFQGDKDIKVLRTELLKPSE